MLVMVPIALAASFILSSAARFVMPDITAGHAESQSQAAGRITRNRDRADGRACSAR